MALFAAGKLPADERPAVEVHLDGCALCRRGVAALVAQSSERVTLSLVNDRTAPLEPGVGLEEQQIREGQRIGRYVVRRPLGSGGMGVVIAAHDPELDRD